MDSTKLTEFLPRPVYDVEILKDPNGNDLVKILTYDNDKDGWIEVARVKLSRSEYVRDRHSLDDIGYELFKNLRARKLLIEEFNRRFGR